METDISVVKYCKIVQEHSFGITFGVLIVTALDYIKSNIAVLFIYLFYFFFFFEGGGGQPQLRFKLNSTAEKNITPKEHPRSWLSKLDQSQEF